MKTLTIIGLTAALGITLAVLPAQEAAAKSWCQAIYKPAAKGNYALRGGSLGNAGWRVFGPYSSSRAARSAASGYRKYIQIGPTTCAKIGAFRGWISSRGSRVSSSQMSSWNSSYNCRHWGKC